MNTSSSILLRDAAAGPCISQSQLAPKGGLVSLCQLMCTSALSVLPAAGSSTNYQDLMGVVSEEVEASCNMEYPFGFDKGRRAKRNGDFSSKPKKNDAFEAIMFAKMGITPQMNKFNDLARTKGGVSSDLLHSIRQSERCLN